VARPPALEAELDHVREHADIVEITGLLPGRVDRIGAEVF